jgi:hypothetical protein
LSVTSKELADNGPAPQPRPQGAASVLDFEPSDPDADSGSVE